MHDLDIKIISMLQANGRVSNVEIARNVGISEGTVRRRLKRLIQDEFIRVSALRDPDKIDQVAEGLARLDEVEWVTITTGAYDIFAWAALQSGEALGIFLRTKVGTLPGVQRTETFVNLSVKKRGYGISV